MELIGFMCILITVQKKFVLHSIDASRKLQTVRHVVVEGTMTINTSFWETGFGVRESTAM
jgi:hypothetical protein